SYRRPAEGLDEMWWNEFCSSMDELPENLFLLVSERPIAFDVIRPDLSMPSVSYRQFPHNPRRGREYAVFVDVARLSREEWMPSVIRAKGLLSELAQHVTGGRRKRDWPEMLM